MLNDLIIARSMMQTEHVDLVRAGEQSCARGGMLRVLGGAYRAAQQLANRQVASRRDERPAMKPQLVYSRRS